MPFHAQSSSTEVIYTTCFTEQSRYWVRGGAAKKVFGDMEVDERKINMATSTLPKIMFLVRVRQLCIKFFLIVLIFIIQQQNNYIIRKAALSLSQAKFYSQQKKLKSPFPHTRIIKDEPTHKDSTCSINKFQMGEMLVTATLCSAMSIDSDC